MNNNSATETTRVFLVRHGVTAQTGTVMYGHTKGLDLSDEGQEQAKLLSDYLSMVHVDAIFSSPLERAYQTAEAIAKDRGLEITVRDALIDTHIGAWTNFTLKECAEFPEWKTVQEHPSQFRFPDGETFAELLERIDLAIRDIVSSHIGKNIVITCHRDPILVVLSSYMGLHMDLFQRISCVPASVSEVRFTDGIARVESINVVPTQRMV